jgi:predicted Zn-dependent protease
MTHIKGMLPAVVAAALFGTVAADAQFVASEKEVKRQDRVEWLYKKRHIPIVEDERVQNYARCIFKRVLAELPEETTAQYGDLEWEVLVFDEDSFNASADSNGKIELFSGLLDIADNQDALAAVIGHEIAHITQGHIMARSRKAARQEIWSTLGGAVTGAPNEIRAGLLYGSMLPFVREEETESDLVGLGYMADAGFDPRAAMYLWKGMAAASAQRGGNNRQAEFERTHPTDDKRLRDIASALGPALAKYNAAREAGKRPNCSIATAAPPTGTGTRPNGTP